MATARSLSGTASGYWAHLALTEALYGDPRRAVGRGCARSWRRTATAAESPGTIPRFRAGGRARPGRAWRPKRASWSSRGAAALPRIDADATGVRADRGGRNRARARRAGRSASPRSRRRRPAEFGTVAGLVPTFLRGEAYLASRRRAAAARASIRRCSTIAAPIRSRRSSRWPGSGWRAPGGWPATSTRAARSTTSSCTIWKDADPDLPLARAGAAPSARGSTASAASTGASPPGDRTPRPATPRNPATPSPTTACSSGSAATTTRTIYRARDLTARSRRRGQAAVARARRRTAKARERFRREAHIASLVSHPHICAVHDSGEEDGQAFLVCELLEGERARRGARRRPASIRARPRPRHPARRRHRRRAPPRPRPRQHQAVERLRDRRRARQGARARGDERVVGNLRPSRTTSTARRRPPRSTQRAPRRRRRRGLPLAIGRPEHLAGERLDHRSDIFSIGAVLYEMATGERAFPGDTPSRIAAAIVSGTPAAGERQPPVARARIEPIVHKALEKIAATRAIRRAAEHARRPAPRAPAASRRPRATAACRPPRRSGRILTGGRRAADLSLAAAGGWWWRGRAGRAGRAPRGADRQRRQRHQRSRLRRHAAPGARPSISASRRSSTSSPTSACAQMLQMMGARAAAPLTHAVAREACERLQAGALIEGQRLGGRPRNRRGARGIGLRAAASTIARDQVEVERKEDVLKAVGGIASIDAPLARRVGRVARGPQRADPGGDDAVARGAEGVHRRRRAACGGRRDRVDPVLRCGPSSSIPSSRSPTRRCRASTAASVRPGAARNTRGSRTNIASTSASASASSSRISTTTG